MILIFRLITPFLVCEYRGGFKKVFPNQFLYIPLPAPSMIRVHKCCNLAGSNNP
nr:MAG TPA: hypothetical protein [Caudoviricetes sp.]